ncbi:MAG: hypothetical protein ACRD2W_08560 [Acidimicrobiales bacterium]
MLGVVVVLGAALLVGFRPDANPAEWAAAVGLFGLMALALTWFCAAWGWWPRASSPPATCPCH